MSDFPYTGDTEHRHMPHAEVPYTDETQRHRMPHAEISGCALVQDLIPLYLDGEVTPESHVLMADHLQRCERCSGYLAGARAVRSQILNEQQKIRAVTTQAPTAEQARQPVVRSLGRVLWQSFLWLLYAVGLFGIFIAFADSQPEALLVGGIMLVGALTGLLLSGSLFTASWRVLMWATSGIGALLGSAALADGGPNGGAVFVYSIGLIMFGLWGVWLHRTQQPASHHTSATPTQSLHKGAYRAMLTAAVMVLGSGACLMAGLAGLVLLISEPQVEVKLIGTTIMGMSAVGLLTLTQRLGWHPQWLKQQGLRQTFGLLLLAIGTLWSSFVVQHALSGAIPVLVLLAVGAGAIFIGYRLLQQNHV